MTISSNKGELAGGNLTVSWEVCTNRNYVAKRKSIPPIFWKIAFSMLNQIESLCRVKEAIHAISI